MVPASTASTTLLNKQFGLTTAADELVPRLTQAGRHDALPVLVELFEAEAEARRQRRIARLRRASRLPPGKTFETLDTGRLPAPLVQKLETLATGAFLETATNVLAFGLPGIGKSDALCAVGHALVKANRSVLCVAAYALVPGTQKGDYTFRLGPDAYYLTARAPITPLANEPDIAPRLQASQVSPAGQFGGRHRGKRCARANWLSIAP